MIIQIFFKDKGISGKIMCTLKYEDLGWRSGYLRDIGDDIVLYHHDAYEPGDIIPEEPKYLNSFFIILHYQKMQVEMILIMIVYLIA